MTPEKSIWVTAKRAIIIFSIIAGIFSIIGNGVLLGMWANQIKQNTKANERIEKRQDKFEKKLDDHIEGDKAVVATISAVTENLKNANNNINDVKNSFNEIIKEYRHENRK